MQLTRDDEKRFRQLLKDCGGDPKTKTLGADLSLRVTEILHDLESTKRDLDQLRKETGK